MKIASASLALQSQHAHAVRRQEEESLRAWIGSRRPDSGDTAPRAASPAEPAPTSADGVQEAAGAADGDPRLALLKLLIEFLTGQAMKVFDAGELRPASSAPAADATSQAAPAPAAAGYGIEYDYHASRQETEQTRFAAEGTVQTADGREFAFRLDVAMSRQETERVDLSFRAGDAKRKDPLVINFAGDAARLLDTRFRFDLDADGKAQDLPLLAGGSGYLAIDRNGNGRIDSGAELFGPANCSGFAELARYDQDGNSWIDDNDPALGRLQVWQPDAQGQGRLTRLKDTGVGALYLGRAATPFALRGQNNSDLGAVRETGLYLTEAGQAGSLQEVDLTI